MKRIPLSLVPLFLFLGVSAVAQDAPTITVVNQAGDSATVHVVGPTSGSLDVSVGSSRTVSVRGGTYTLKVRYCNGQGRCHFSKTDPFNVTQTAYQVSEITVTLHSVGGNLGERDISESEFNGN